MARSVYVTGSSSGRPTAAGAGDARQLIELGVMELLSRRVDRVGLFRPLTRPDDRTGPAGDDTVELLCSRYHIDLPPELLTGPTYEAAAALQAEHGRDALVAALVDRFHAVERGFGALLVLGSDFAGPELPDELALNARLANEFGALALPVVGCLDHGADAVAAEVTNAYHAYLDLGCSVPAVIATRVPPDEVAAARERLADFSRTRVPAYVVPEDAALAAPTVGQVIEATDAQVLLGHATGLAREVHGYVLGAALLPRFLAALQPGSLAVIPGDRADLLIGALAAHAAEAPAIAGVLLTLGEVPEPNILEVAGRLAPALAVGLAPGLSFETAARLAPLEGRLTAAAPRRVQSALGLFAAHVDEPELTARIDLELPQRMTPLMFEHELMERARGPEPADIVLAEGDEERVLRAADLLLRRQVCRLTVLGRPAAVARRAAEFGLDLSDARVIDPAGSPMREEFAAVYAKMRAHKGVTLDQAYDLVADPSYFGTLLVERGLADGMVSGAVHSTAATLRPAFEIIGTEPGAALVSSVFFMCLADRVLVYGDCAVNPDPDARQLAEIALQSADTAAAFGVEPRVALLSYSTGESGRGADVDKVREAADIVRSLRPGLLAEGPIQYDAAVDPTVAAAKLPDSAVAGRATVLVFPDLNTGNNTYKAVQRSAGAVAVGPVLQGLRKPVNDLSRGALVQDIVTTVAITAVQAGRLRERIADLTAPPAEPESAADGAPGQQEVKRDTGLSKAPGTVS